MKAIGGLLVVFLLISGASAFAGTSYYVDAANGNDANNGRTISNAWKTISRVNSHSFSVGDDVFFKCGETWNGRLAINWSGTASDEAIIGAYYESGGSPVHAVSGSRPKIHGDQQASPLEQGSWNALIDNSNGSHITVKDLRVEYSGGLGIQFKDASDITVKNCYIYRTYRNGILFGRVDTGTIFDNIVEETSYIRTGAAGITITGLDRENSCIDVVVRGNKVFKCWEGIGLYKMAKACIAEYNHVYDNRSYQIYVDGGANNIIRYNVVYTSSEKSGRGSPAISVDCEQERCNMLPNRYPYGSDNEIYGNMIARTAKGISLFSN